MIYYKLETKLTGKALLKMEDSIPPLIQHMTDLVDECDSIDNLLDKVNDLPFNTLTWINSESVPEYEVWILLSRSSMNLYQTKAIFDMRDLVRDFKIKKLFE